MAKISKAAKTSRQEPSTGFDKTFEKIYRTVLRIPRGRVMTYGQIARLLEDRYSPRLVGWAMHATPDDGRDIPWHRVVNSKGGISTGRIIVHQPDLQRLLLEAEGVVFNERGHLDLNVYQWSPRQKKEQAISKSAIGAKSTPRRKKAVAASSPKKTKKT